MAYRMLLKKTVYVSVLVHAGSASAAKHLAESNIDEMVDELEECALDCSESSGWEVTNGSLEEVPDGCSHYGPVIDPEDESEEGEDDEK